MYFFVLCQHIFLNKYLNCVRIKCGIDREPDTGLLCNLIIYKIFLKIFKLLDLILFLKHHYNKY